MESTKQKNARCKGAYKGSTRKGHTTNVERKYWWYVFRPPRMTAQTRS